MNLNMLTNQTGFGDKGWGAFSNPSTQWLETVTSKSPTPTDLGAAPKLRKLS